MEGNTTPHTPSYVVIAFDATKDHNEREFRIIINHIRVRGDILHGGDTLLMLGILHRVTHPSKHSYLSSDLPINDDFDVCVCV